MSSSRPVALTVAAVLVFVEALGVSATTVWFVAQFFTQKPDNLAGALLIAVLLASSSVWLWLTGVGLLRRRTWVRASVVVWQSTQVVVGFGMFGASTLWEALGVAMIVLGLAGGVLIFLPSVVAVTAREVNRD